jgi:hypothetical protein
LLANLALLLTRDFRTLRREIYEIRGLGFEFAATPPNESRHPARVLNAAIVAA